jgi:hypothetical protein
MFFSKESAIRAGEEAASTISRLSTVGELGGDALFRIEPRDVEGK